MMAPNVRDIIIIWFLLVHPVISDKTFKNSVAKSENDNYDCSTVRPSLKMIVNRFNDMLSFFDVDQGNTAFTQKFQLLIKSMFEGDDMLDREAAFYAVILTPLIFLHKYKDSWCLFVKFHDALRTYRRLSTSDKQKYLKILQSVKNMSKKIRDAIFNLPVNRKEYRITTDSMEGDLEMELKSTIPLTRVTQIEATANDPLDDRKKFDLKPWKSWSSEMAFTRVTPAGPDRHIVNDMLRNFILNQPQKNKSPETKTGLDNVQYVKQLLKSLG